MSSIKQIQSELGTTGECSPNAQLVEQVGLLLNGFQHNHHDITAYDCFILLTNCVVGHKIGEEKQKTAVGVSQKGCMDDLANLLAIYLIENPNMIWAFTFAISAALSQLKNKKE